MISKKVCMLGAFSVGKTSLVEKYVRSIFSDKYLSTVGLKISKKQLEINETELSLVLWDMEGKDDFIDINLSYLRGAMGFFVVADLTRGETVDTALQIRKVALEQLGNVPNILLMNKCDMDDWEVGDSQIEAISQKGVDVLKTSAKTGEGVEEAFRTLATRMLEKK
jgi:small GTP-binding protein